MELRIGFLNQRHSEFIWIFARSEYQLRPFPFICYGAWQLVVNNHISPLAVFEKPHHIESIFRIRLKNRGIHSFAPPNHFLQSELLSCFVAFFNGSLNVFSGASQQLISSGQHWQCPYKPTVSNLSLHNVIRARAFLDEFGIGPSFVRSESYHILRIWIFFVWGLSSSVNWIASERVFWTVSKVRVDKKLSFFEVLY